MTINRSFISTEPASEALTRIEIVAQRPSTDVLNDPPETPLRIVGYYNQQLNAVELYVVDRSGLRWIRV
jgi:hypothetical protein